MQEYKSAHEQEHSQSTGSRIWQTLNAMLAQLLNESITNSSYHLAVAASLFSNSLNLSN